MKIFIIIILFTFIQATNSPIGTWEYKQDKSRMEIINRDGKLSGSLIFSRNPNRNSGNKIIKNMEFREGKWRGEFYLYKSDRWVNAIFEIKRNLLHIEYKYGFLTTNLHFYRVK